MAMSELKQVLGALVFGASRPLSVREMRACLLEVAETAGADARAFAGVKDADINRALEELNVALISQSCGFMLAEVAGGYRLQSDPECGKWLKHLLDKKPHRLSRPGLETLAIIAYRQPATRGEIESIRGVSVDHVLKMLMEMQLVRIVGRSDLPGRPFLYGTSQSFLEHFGLKDLQALEGMDMLKRRAESAAAGGKTAEPAPATDGDDDADEFDDDDDGEDAEE